MHALQDWPHTQADPLSHTCAPAMSLFPEIHSQCSAQQADNRAAEGASTASTVHPATDTGVRLHARHALAQTCLSDSLISYLKPVIGAWQPGHSFFGCFMILRAHALHAFWCPHGSNVTNGRTCAWGALQQPTGSQSCDI